MRYLLSALCLLSVCSFSTQLEQTYQLVPKENEKNGKITTGTVKNETKF